MNNHSKSYSKVTKQKNHTINKPISSYFTATHKRKCTCPQNQGPSPPGTPGTIGSKSLMQYLMQYSDDHKKQQCLTCVLIYDKIRTLKMDYVFIFLSLFILPGLIGTLYKINNMPLIFILATLLLQISYYRCEYVYNIVNFGCCLCIIHLIHLITHLQVIRESHG